MLHIVGQLLIQINDARNHEYKIQSLELLTSDFDMLFYMLGAQLFLRSQTAPHSKNSFSEAES